MSGEERPVEIEPEETDPLSGQQLNLAKSQLRNYYLSGYGNLPFMIAIIVILADSDDDCDKPIRAWLRVVMIVSAVSVAAAVVESFSGWMNKGGNFLISMFMLLSMFNFVWYIVGSVWLFNDDDCEDDWKEGYTLTLVLLIFFYVACGLLLLICCCCCFCVGVFAAIGGTTEGTDPKQN
jgi:hypothetical protein